MARFHYSVRATISDHALRDAYEQWLKGGHVQDVLQTADVEWAEVVREDGTPTVIVCNYVFASRAAFAAYDAGPAIKLRQEGRERFPFGVTWERRTAIELLHVART